MEMQILGLNGVWIFGTSKNTSTRSENARTEKQKWNMPDGDERKCIIRGCHYYNVSPDNTCLESPTTF
jgi:hypothetical protein